MINDFAERHHAFEGCFNFRDIGGYRTRDGGVVRWHRIIRGGKTRQNGRPADLARLASMGIKTQIDLRRPDEAAEQGRGPLPELGAK